MKAISNADVRTLLALLERYEAQIEQIAGCERTTRQHNDKRLIKILKKKLTK